jgi:glycosyltransferase involved in cell wall biosynthesis
MSKRLHGGGWVDLSIVIPVFNERDNLPHLLADMAKLAADAPCGIEVLAVNDGSTDGTGALLDEQKSAYPWLRVLHQPNRGMGAALKAGTAAARHPLVAWVMADRSDHLNDLWTMRERLLAGADLVIASRAAAGGSYGELRGIKATCSRAFSLFAELLLRLPVSDCTNAFRAFRQSAFVTLDLRRNDFAISPELVFQAHARGWRVEQTPTVYSFRRRGISNFRVVRMGTIYLRLALTAFAARLTRYVAGR